MAAFLPDSGFPSPFAAFPGWYASWLSSSYLLFVVVLLGLIGRAVAFEWRHAREDSRWERGFSVVILGGSLLASAGLGGALAAAPQRGHSRSRSIVWARVVSS